MTLTLGLPSNNLLPRKLFLPPPSFPAVIIRVRARPPTAERSAAAQFRLYRVTRFKTAAARRAFVVIIIVIIYLFIINFLFYFCFLVPNTETDRVKLLPVMFFASDVSTRPREPYADDRRGRNGRAGDDVPDGRLAGRTTARGI